MIRVFFMTFSCMTLSVSAFPEELIKAKPEAWCTGHSAHGSYQWECNKNPEYFGDLICESLSNQHHSWSFLEFSNKYFDYPQEKWTIRCIRDDGSYNHPNSVKRNFYCSSGGMAVKVGEQKMCTQSDHPEPDCSCQTGCTSNPIILASGGKYKNIVDYESRNLSVERTYYFDAKTSGSWLFDVQRERLEIIAEDQVSEPTKLLYYNPQGVSREFIYVDGEGIFLAQGEGGKIEELDEGYVLVSNGKRFKEFDYSGFLKKEYLPNGDEV